MPRIFASRHGAGREGVMPREASVVVIALRSAGPVLPLAYRHRVDQAAFRPLGVEPAVEFERRSGAEVAFEDLTVIADRLDFVIGPILLETQSLAHAGGDAEHALDSRVVAFQHVVDIGLGDADLLALHQSVDGPIDDVVPLVIAMADDRS